MGATIQQDSNGVWVVRISGALRKEELDAIQDEALSKSPPINDVRLMIMVEPDFRGWVSSEAWNDMTFFVKHGDKIARIAMVGDPKWESRMLMFAGAGFRRAPVKYFPRERLPEAYGWLG